MRLQLGEGMAKVPVRKSRIAYTTVQSDIAFLFLHKNVTRSKILKISLLCMLWGEQGKVKFKGKNQA